MKMTHGLAALAVLALVVAVAIWWRGSAQPAVPERTLVHQSNPAAMPEHDASSSPVAGRPASAAPAPREERSEVAAPRGAPPTRTGPREPTSESPSPALGGAAGGRRGRRVSWPVRRMLPAGDAAAAQTPTEPVVPVKLAFRALWYLGVDPEAEKTWSRAINDPTLAAGVRSDLIVDMIDEGYTDNNHPTKADLPVILARLEIIERYSPYAMDDVNAKAFESAYRQLLAMYVRLGGAPRKAP